MKEENKHMNLNRTFARRIGKALSQYRKNLIDSELPKYLYNPELLLPTKYDKIILEIGFGMGEHFINQIKANPNNLYIGAEVYINGVANFLKQIEEIKVNNFLIWPDDLDSIIDKLPKLSLDGIYILFPDPWHKRKALKKRLFNKFRLGKFKNMLKAGGFIIFASDIEDYFEIAHELLKSDLDFIIKDNDFTIPHAGYVQTKYHSKALKEGRTAQFIQAYLK